MEQRRKKRELPEEARMKIIEQHIKGKGYKSIAKQLDVPRTTVASIIRKVKDHGSVANLPGRGRKRKIDPNVNQEIERMIDEEPNKTFKEIQAELQGQGTSVSTSTIRRFMKESGLKGRRPPSATPGEGKPKKIKTATC